MTGKKIPWWLWPNLLSLDAPIVALAWSWMYVKFWNIRLIDPIIPWVFVGAVWVIYVIDRLRDVSLKKDSLEIRHQFHWRHRKWLMILVGIVMVLLAASFFFLPRGLTWNWPRPFPHEDGEPLLRQVLNGLIQTLFSPGVFVLLFALVFFYVGRSAVLSIERRLFKNLIGGLTFALGSATIAHFYHTHGNPFASLLMLGSFEVLAFALLCWLNMNAIDVWEEEKQEVGDMLEYRDYILTLPSLVLGFLSFLAAQYWDAYRKPFFYSIFVACAALLMLDRYRDRLSANLLRVLADAALLLPLPIFYFWFRT